MAGVLCANAEIGLCGESREFLGNVSFALDWCTGATEIVTHLGGLEPNRTYFARLFEAEPSSSTAPASLSSIGRPVNLVAAGEAAAPPPVFATEGRIHRMADEDEDDADVESPAARNAKSEGFLCPIATDERGKAHTLFTTREIQLLHAHGSPNQPIGRIVAIDDGQRIVATGVCQLVK